MTMYQVKIRPSETQAINPTSESARTDHRMMWFDYAKWNKQNPLDDFGVPTRAKYDEICNRIARQNNVGVRELLAARQGVPAHPARDEVVAACIAEGMNVNHIAAFMGRSVHLVRMVEWRVRRGENETTKGDSEATPIELQLYRRIARRAAKEVGVSVDELMASDGTKTHPHRRMVIARSIHAGVRIRALAALLGVTVNGVKHSLRRVDEDAKNAAKVGRMKERAA